MCLKAGANVTPAERLLLTLFFVVSCILFWSTRVMAADNQTSQTGGGKYTLLWSGGHDWGSREISFDGNRRFYYAIGDTLRSDTETGVGAFQLDLQNADLEEAKTAANILCDERIRKDAFKAIDSPGIFSVTCFEEGVEVAKKGTLQAIPEDLVSKLYAVTSRLSSNAYVNGKKLVKLDFYPDEIGYQEGKFIVSVRFVNSGDRWIKFATPDQWPGTTWGGRLGVGAVSKVGNGGKDEVVQGSWGFALGGQKLLNRDEFPEGIVTLKPGEAKILKFETVPDNKAVKGQYEFSGVAFMNIECEGGGVALSGLVVLGPIRKRITIDRDYPSTPEERKQWEATHRADMSSQPVKPGQTFAEDGLYRAVRTNGGYRSLQVRPFKAGDVATTDNVKMLMESASGTELNGPVQWVWEAAAPTRVKQWSPDIIEDTAQFCKPGADCPRSGRWIRRTRSNDLYGQESADYDLASLVTLRRGQRMPSSPDDTDRIDWEWTGAGRG
jgi:hypothetical protein